MLKYHPYDRKKYCQHSNHTRPDLANLPHGGLVCALIRVAPGRTNSRSAAFSLGLSKGLSRYQSAKAAAQTTPRPPKISNACRHPTQVITAAARGGVNAPPHRALIHIRPWARTRSRSGSQMVNILVRLGKQPAS